MVMLGSFNIDTVLNTVKESTEMGLVYNSKSIYDDVMENVVNAILLNNDE